MTIDPLPLYDRLRGLGGYQTQEEKDADWEAEQDEKADPKYATGGGEDAELALWLREVMERRIMYNHSTRMWHVFDTTSGLWREDTTTEVQRMVEQKVREVFRNAEFLRISQSRLKTLGRLLVNRHLEAALVALARHPEYKTDGSDMDADPYLLGCENGVVDLRTSTLLAPDPARRVSRSTGVAFRGDLTERQAQVGAERFLMFLLEVASGDADLARFFLRWYGYSLLGHTRAHKFLVMTGKLGRNGKGVLKRVMLKVFGEYAKELDRSIYSTTRFGHNSAGPRADLIQLRGLRLTFISEPEGSFDTNLLKGHTGGDPINARTLQSRVQQTWEPTHNIVFSCNETPPVSEVGHAIRDRVMVADFRERFTGERQDQHLDDKLADEAECILFLLVHSARQWEEADTAEEALPLPARVVEASAAYMVSNDPTGGFVEHGAVVENSAKCAPSDLYRDYHAWNDEFFADDPREAVSQADFGKYVGGLFEKKGKPLTYRGIRGKTAAELASAG